MEAIFQPSKSTLAIERFLKEKNPGDLVSFEEIQKGTKVTMDTKGKGYLRTALNRLKLEYLPHIGMGIEIANEKTTITVINNRVKRIDSSVKRGAKSHKILVNKHYSQLGEADKKRADFVGAVFAIIRTEARELRRMIIDKPPTELGNSNKPII